MRVMKVIKGKGIKRVLRWYRIATKRDLSKDEIKVSASIEYHLNCDGGLCVARLTN